MTELVLIAAARKVEAPALPGGFTLGAPGLDEAERLGQLYFDADVPYADVPTTAAATDEVREFFQGEFGDFWPEASGTIEHAGRLVAALLAVHRAPWDDTPDCCFITDLFTDPAYRRRGLARVLVARCLASVSSTSRPRVALRADSSNIPAMHLYQRMGFEPYQPA